MPVRMTGMISGLDTESLIKGMVDAQKIKNKRTTDKSTLLEWKQEKWKDLNAKIYKLYTEDLGKLRMTSAYGTKKVTSSNENLVSIKGGSNAPVGSHTIEDIKLAKAQTMTSNVITTSATTNGGKVTSSSKLVNLGGESDRFQVGTVLTFQSGTKDAVTLEVKNNTTINDLITSMKKAGINANFDEKQGRIFLSSKESGEANGFTMEAEYHHELEFKYNIQDAIKYSSMTAADKKKVDEALETIKSNAEGTEAYDKALDLLNEELIKTKKEEFKTSEYKRILAEENAKVDQIIRSEVENDADTILKVDTLRQQLQNEGKTTEEIELAIEKEIQAKVKEAIAEEKKNPGNRYEGAASKAKEKSEENTENLDLTTAIAELKTNIDSYKSKSAIPSPDDIKDVNGRFKSLGLAAVVKTGDKYELKGDIGTYAKFDAGSDSSFLYNGILVTDSSNEVSINGFTITLKGESPVTWVDDPNSADGKGKIAVSEKITFTSNNDTQATYDMIKNFVKNYNELLNEMNTLYYAESSRGYDPLSDEEREAMSEKQIEKWETKIKDSILRRDNTVNSISSMMRLTATRSYAGEVSGAYKSLSSIGIVTSTVYTEKGLLHIEGNAEDSLYAANENKLMKALQEDPDSVIELMSAMTSKMYSELDSKMSSIPNVRSKFTVYNDKSMAAEQTKYKKKIAELEKKLSQIESKYYKQFAAMEKAMANMQSQGNALAGMLGTGNQ